MRWAKSDCSTHSLEQKARQTVLQLLIHARTCAGFDGASVDGEELEGAKKGLEKTKVARSVEPNMESLKTAYIDACGKAGIKPRTQILDVVTEAQGSGCVAASFACQFRLIQFLVCSAARLPPLELLGSSKELFVNRITDADVEALVHAVLTSGVSVDGLFLCYNHITDRGAAALARLFQVYAPFLLAFTTLPSNSMPQFRIRMRTRAHCKRLTCEATRSRKSAAGS